MGSQPSLPDSYVENVFNSILECSEKIYKPILSEEECKLLSILRNRTACEQRLVFRLYMRKDVWIKVNTISYFDIPNIEETISLMQTSDLLADLPEEMVEWIDILTMYELKGVCKSLKIFKSGLKREQYLKILNESCNSKQRRLRFLNSCRPSIGEERRKKIIELSQQLLGPIIRLAPKIRDLLKRMISIHFLDFSEEQEKLTASILEATERQKFPNYYIHITRPVWLTRDELQMYEDALSMETMVIEQLEGTESIDIVLDLYKNINNGWLFILESKPNFDDYFLARYSNGWVYTRILNTIANFFEKQKLHEKAVEILEQLLSQQTFNLGCRGGWWERLLINKSRHLKESPSSITSVCENALSDPHVKASIKRSIKKRLSKVTKTPILEPEIEKITIYADSEMAGLSSGKKSLYLLKDEHFGSVEDLALEYFADLGWNGMHCEGRFISMLFSLVFWDILFPETAANARPNVFYHKFQHSPLDLMTDAFFEGRKNSILGRLDHIKELNTLKHTISENYKRNEGCMAIGVDWNISLAAMTEICESIKPLPLVHMLKHLAVDYRHRSGVPDLLLWRSGGDYMLVEVKSPNDRLSDAQNEWINLFHENKIKFTLLNVSSTNKQI